MGVGFIALAGVAAETGVVMLIYLDISYRKFKERYGQSPLEVRFGRIVHLLIGSKYHPILSVYCATVDKMWHIGWISRG